VPAALSLVGKTGPIVGIDLGTTNSLVSVIQAGRPVVLPNALGDVLTPSAVSVGEGGEILVGAPALARRGTHPDRTVTAFKRDMGTDRVFELAGQRFSPQQLSALVLRALKHDAEVALSAVIEEAVITVPAYFDETQRRATRDAAAIAGLRAERIINEPTAAALAYGLHNRDREFRAVVLDLGGGTFDVTVLEVIEGVIEIQSTAGDTRLGGEDFVEALAALCAGRLGAAPGNFAPAAWARLRVAAERAKRALSSVEAAPIVVPDLAVPGRGDVRVEETVTRAEAEAAWAPLIERLRAPILRALRDARREAAEGGEILLVGGATRMPCVAQLAREIFGKPALQTLPADEAVALGAAVQAALKARDEAVGDVVVTDVAPFSMGIAVASEIGRQRVTGLYTPILERGTVIPASRVQTFSTVEHGQTRIKVEVYQGEHSLCRDNKRLGELDVTGLPPAPAGAISLAVRFTYDLNGLLEVEATVPQTGAIVSTVLENTPGRLSAKEIEAARKALERLKIHPRDALPNAAALHRAEARFQDLTGDARQELGTLIGFFRAALESQKPKLIEEVRGRLLAMLDAPG
jgi:molecular chaperone HscC